MSSKMSMVFSQNNSRVGSNRGIIMKRTVSAPAPAPAPPAPAPKQQHARAIVSGPMARSAPRGIKQLFNLGHIMANPGTPCKACGS
jgi:hypothetical protein